VIHGLDQLSHMVAEKQLEWRAFKCLGWPGALSTAAKSS
jgi:hypothetical protein